MNETANHIITIGRNYGSGGREIGKRLAAELNIPFYDKELIRLAAEKSGMSEDYLAKADESAMNKILYSLSTGSLPPFALKYTNLNNMPIHDRLFFMQTRLIRQFAEQGPCVVIGRCANYILQDKKNVINIFITAPFQERLLRIRTLQPSLTESQCESLIKKTDKQRAEYYSTYTNHTWSCVQNYHLALDSSQLGLVRSVDLIQSYIAMRELSK